MKTFCDNIYYNKRILKCVFFIGKINVMYLLNYRDKYVVENIKKNIDKDDPFEKLSNNPEKKIKDLYYYLTSQESDDFDLMKKEIIDKLS